MISQIQIQISVDAKEATVTNMLKKIDPLLTYQLNLAKRVKLIDTLKEVSTRSRRSPTPPAHVAPVRLLTGPCASADDTHVWQVRMQEPDASFLAPEYLEILENEEQIKRELKEQPGRLQFLHGIIVDLFVDNAKFKGQNVTAQVPQLQRVLQDYSIDNLLGFFNRS